MKRTILPEEFLYITEIGIHRTLPLRLTHVSLTVIIRCNAKAKTQHNSSTYRLRLSYCCWVCLELLFKTTLIEIKALAASLRWRSWFPTYPKLALNKRNYSGGGKGLLTGCSAVR